MLQDTDRCFKRVAHARKEARGSWAGEGLVVGVALWGGDICLRKNILGQDSEVRKSVVFKDPWEEPAGGGGEGSWGLDRAGKWDEAGRIQLWSTKAFIPRDWKPLGLLSRAVT